ncbi:MAG: helix-turn-helix transcriptional regulator [Streptosporangiaceae bacterium]
MTKTPTNTWSTDETASFLGVPVETMYHWTTNKVGPRSFKIGRSRRYNPDDVMAWLKEQASDRQERWAPNGRQPLIDVKDLAEYLGVPVETVYGWNKTRTGPRYLKVGRHVRYRWSDVDSWLGSQETGMAR